MARHIVFLSNETRQQALLNSRKAIFKRSRVIGHGLLDLPQKTVRIKQPVSDQPVLTIIGTVKQYKGTITFLENFRGSLLNQNNLRLDVIGKWDKSLVSQKEHFTHARVAITDKFIDHEELSKLLNENRIYVLPHKNASQSGLMYLLLNYSKCFISSGAGDIGKMLVEFQLEKALYDPATPGSIVTAYNYVQSKEARVRFQALKSFVERAHVEI